MPAGSLAPLPGARREVDAIARYARVRGLVLRGAAASRDAIDRLDLRRFRVLHFATHGLVSDRAPERSALLLGAGSRSPDAREGEASSRPPALWIQAKEIARWQLDADLVVLSACRTAGGRILNGEGPQSLARAFLDAGSSAVVASLWLADDAKTAHLMEVFYGRMAAGEPPVEALRSAKAETARDRSVPLSSRASFILVGDGGRPLNISDVPVASDVPGAPDAPHTPSASPATWAVGLCFGLLAAILVTVVVRRRLSIDLR